MVFFSMLGNGDIHFLDDKLDFNLRLDMKGPGIVLLPMYKLFEYAGEGEPRRNPIGTRRDFRQFCHSERSEESQIIRLRKSQRCFAPLNMTVTGCCGSRTDH